MNIVVVLFSWLVAIVAAQQCAFSCPRHSSLVKRAEALGPTSWYSIFDCFYADAGKVTKCSYDKKTGAHTLGHARDNCPPTAAPCTATETPAFSNLARETPPWVPIGRDLLWIKQNPRPE